MGLRKRRRIRVLRISQSVPIYLPPITADSVIKVFRVDYILPVRVSSEFELVTVLETQVSRAVERAQSNEK